MMLEQTTAMAPPVVAPLSGRALLSQLLTGLPQQMAPMPFVRNVRVAVREGRVHAAYATGMFRVAGHPRQVREMVILSDDAWHSWYTDLCGRTCRGAARAAPVTPARQLLAGINWDEEVSSTRQALHDELAQDGALDLPERALLSQVLTDLPRQVAPMLFVRKLRSAVRGGEIEAAYAPEMFALPGLPRQVREMVILSDETWHSWYADLCAAARKSSGRAPLRTPTPELLAGINWDQEVKRTREELIRRHANGHALALTGQGAAAKRRAPPQSRQKT